MFSAALRLRPTHPAMILNLVGMGVALSLLGDSTLYIVLPLHYEQAGIAASQVGIMLAANRGVRIFINSPYGVLIERLPRRHMMIPSLLLGGLASLLYTIPGFWPLLLGRLLWGAGWAGIYLGSTTMILDLARADNRGSMIGRLQMWFFAGIGVSSLLGGVLFDQLGYRATFLFSSAVICSMAAAWALLLPETYQPRDASLASPKNRGGLKGLHLDFPLRVAILIYGLQWLIFIGSVLALLSRVLEDRFGGEVLLFGLATLPLVSFAGGLSSFNTVISLITAPLSGHWTDRGGRRWRLILAALSAGVCSLIVMAVGSGTMVVLATMVNAVITGLLGTQITALVGDHAPIENRGRILGVMNTAGDIGGTLGPLLAFAALPTLGLPTIFLICAGLLLGVLPLALRAYRIDANHRPA